MSKETSQPHQPPLNMLGCIALLNAVRADRPRIRVKLRTAPAAPGTNPGALGIATERPDRLTAIRG
jgi:hypothetical protein